MTSPALVQDAPAAAVGAWDNPPAVAPRGTVILVAGRGEHPGVYERFGTRISFDGYKVRVVGDPTVDEEATRAQVRQLLDDPDLPGPRVLAGSDAGAAFVAALTVAGAGARNRVDGLVLAGLPTAPTTPTTPTGSAALAASTAPTALAASAGPTAQTGADGGTGAGAGSDTWEEELGERTACPTHQARLSTDPRVRRGALAEPVPAAWIAGADLSRVGVPVLAIHGAADLVSPVTAARESVAKAPAAEFVSIAGGRHDALNDATHRTAAAVLVLFLERLRDAATEPAPAALPEIARWTRWS